MRIDRVQVEAFGALRDQVLELAPGMTVIFGPNEAGKSTWHAAIYAAVCGMSRGRGRPSKADDLFSQRHKPWEGGPWIVSALLTLADGRRIEMRHDLAGRVDCRATELDTGRDVSNQIMDGMPDASRWLGLDRRSFLATACVRQADLLAILNDSESLQVHLQRAAATAGTDEPAAAALRALDDFLRENVGLDRANSTKPLRRALDAVERAASELELTQEEHQRYIDLAADADRRRKHADDLERSVRIARYSRTKRELTMARERLRRASELQEQLGDDEPEDLSHQRALMGEVRDALAAWRTAPALPTLDLRPSEEIQRELVGLPPMPTGDLEPAPTVVEARARVEARRSARELHGPGPDVDTEPDLGGLSVSQLTELARALSAQEPVVPNGAQAQVDDARSQHEAATRRERTRRALSVGCLVAGVAAGAALIPLNLSAVGAALAVLGLVAAATLFAISTRGKVETLQRLREAEAALGQQGYAVDRARSERQRAMEQTGAAGIPPDPDALHALIREHEVWERQSRDAARWADDRRRLDEAVHSTEEELRRLLEERGVSAEGDVLAAMDSYVTRCAERAALAARAGQRTVLEQELKQREVQEREADRVATQRRSATVALLEAAERIGISDDAGEDEVSVAVDQWLADTAIRIQHAEETLKGWSELKGLFEGNTVDGVQEEIGQKQADLDELRRSMAADELEEAERGSADVANIEEGEREARRVRGEAERLAGELLRMAKSMPDVAAAEEALQRAEHELARVNRLKSTLEQTIQVLRLAEEQVLRDIAPKLAGAIRKMLPRITDGRYTDAGVDPATLQVRVRTASGSWRAADLLSQGTREQVYLLLRMALAEHLTARGEVTPLIFDDVTVQCDTQRTERLLTVLKESADLRQIIVFSQEEDVVTWAERELNDPNHRVARLALLPV